MKGRTITQLQAGDRAEFTKTVTAHDVLLFAGVSGDHNPVHLDETYAQSTMFKTRIAHGMLVGSLFSTVLGTQLPGEGTIYLGQDLKFLRPVYLDDVITAVVTVSEVMPEKNRVRLETSAVNQHGETVVTGSALVMPPKA
jgi:3-hydroxybutyryl-CoA dehydratase